MADLLIGSMESHKEKVEAIEAAEAKKAKKIATAARKHSEEFQKIVTEETLALEGAKSQKEEHQKTLEELEVEHLADEMKKAFKKG